MSWAIPEADLAPYVQRRHLWGLRGCPEGETWATNRGWAARVEECRGMMGLLEFAAIAKLRSERALSVPCERVREHDQPGAWGDPEVECEACCGTGDAACDHCGNEITCDECKGSGLVKKDESTPGRVVFRSHANGVLVAFDARFVALADGLDLRLSLSSQEMPELLGYEPGADENAAPVFVLMPMLDPDVQDINKRMRGGAK